MLVRANTSTTNTYPRIYLEQTMLQFRVQCVRNPDNVRPENLRAKRKPNWFRKHDNRCKKISIPIQKTLSIDHADDSSEISTGERNRRTLTLIPTGVSETMRTSNQSLRIGKCTPAIGERERESSVRFCGGEREREIGLPGVLDLCPAKGDIKTTGPSLLMLRLGQCYRTRVYRWIVCGSRSLICTVRYCCKSIVLGDGRGFLWNSYNTIDGVSGSENFVDLWSICDWEVVGCLCFR